jgi:hypothetical protein
MPLIPLIILGLVFLVGVVALAIGHKGWSWGSVAAAWLVLQSDVMISITESGVSVMG